MRDYQVTRLRGLRMVETWEGDKPGIGHALDALFGSRVVAVSLTDIQETGQGHVQQDLVHAGEATWRLQGGDKRCRIVGQEPLLTVGCYGTMLRLSVGDVRR